MNNFKIIAMAIIFFNCCTSKQIYQIKRSDSIYNSSWKLHSITYEGNNYVFPDNPKYQTNFFLAGKKKESFKGRISIETGVIDKNSNYLCQINKQNKNQAHFSFVNKTKSGYSLFWKPQYCFTNINCNLSKNTFYIPFNKAFNSEGSYELKGDSLIMRGKETVLILVKLQ